MAKKKSPKVVDLPAKQRQASMHLIEKWARTSVIDDDREARIAALLLILDEFERACQDWSRVENIVYSTQDSVFACSDQSAKSRAEFVDSLRQKHGLRIVQKKRATG
jgi:hypothetical protein